MRVRAADAVLFVLLAAVFYLLRCLFQGPLYFVDGPALATAIETKLYAIQPPGYWAYAHLGGLFRDAAQGLAFWNRFFSALGVATFYALCRSFSLTRRLACLAACTYGTAYYIWFSAEIHSAYATETLFPVLTLLCFRCWFGQRGNGWIVAAALSASATMAMRPSDGTFLLPLWIFLLLKERPSGSTVRLFAGVLVVSTTAWLVPNVLAVRAIGKASPDMFHNLLHVTSVFYVGVTPRSLANISRVYVPLLVAFWILGPALADRRTSLQNLMLTLWAAPGLLFYSLLYMADPTYLVYMTGSVVLAAALARQKRMVALVLACTCIWNTGIFLLARPTNSPSHAGLIWTYYVAKYSANGLRMKWSATLGDRQTSAGKLKTGR